MRAKTQTFGEDGERRPLWRAIGRGLRKRCPRCGSGRLFAGYTRVRGECGACALELSGHAADDAPPYVTIMIVGHALIPLALAFKQAFDPPLWAQFAVWTPALVAATLVSLPAVKGAIVGLQWANAMHGFSDEPEAEAWAPKEAG